MATPQSRNQQLAREGVSPNDNTGTPIVPPSGGWGITGWLYEIYKNVSGGGGGFTTTKGAKGAKVFTAVAPTASASLVLAANANRLAATLVNAGTVDVFLGKNNTVTAATGLKLPAGSSLTDYNSDDSWYGITSSGTADIRVMEVS